MMKLFLRIPILGVSATFFLGMCTSTIAQNAPTKASLVVAFPKTYNRVETTKLYGGYLEFLSSCAKIDLVNLRGESIVKRYDALDLLSEKELIDQFQTGKLQLAMLTTGMVPVAVEAKVASPFAVRGTFSTGKIASYRLSLIARLDSNYKKPQDLHGKKIAHSTVGSNSGNLAPRAYFPSLGLTPDKDYTVVYSQGHERSIIGVMHGFYDAAAVASDQFERMSMKGEIRQSSFRTLWESESFPVESMMLGKQVSTDLAEKIRSCSYQYKFPADVVKLLQGSDRFLPVNYEKDYAAVRFVSSQTLAKK
jgi:phosphonate transport system substrate-binding protein